MGKAEILEALPKLNAEERAQVFQRLCELQEEDLLHGAGPSESEKRILDEALAEFERDQDIGTPSGQALSELRSKKNYAGLKGYGCLRGKIWISPDFDRID